MTTPSPQPSARPRWALVVALVAVLVVAVVVLRPGTAVDEAGLERAARDAVARTAEPTRLPETVPPPPDGRLVVRADGVDGLRLGMGVAEVTAAGYVVDQTRSFQGCARITPGLSARPGEGVSGWAVDGRVAVVTVDGRVAPAASFLGPGPGDRLADLEGLPGVLWGTVRAPVAWQDGARTVDVAWARPHPRARVAFADTAGDGTIGHVQVRARAGEVCGPAYGAALEAEETGLPGLTSEGWGDVRVGARLGEVPPSVQLVRDTADGEGCELVLADGETGLLFLVLRDGVVSAVTVDRGTALDGVAIGATPEEVRAAWGPTTSYLLQFWEQGLSVDWVVDGVPVVLYPGRPSAWVPELDAELVGPGPVLGAVQVGQGC